MDVNPAKLALTVRGRFSGSRHSSLFTEAIHRSA
jgi:hypothetical protein